MEPVTAARSMAYASSGEMIFGFARKPVTTRSGLAIGAGVVIPEVVPHPRPGSEASVATLLREFERANGDAIERCVSVGHPCLVLENEHVRQMTHNPRWGAEIAAQAVGQIAAAQESFGLKAAHRVTVADLRKPDRVDLRSSQETETVLAAFEACAPHADILSIESLGGKEIFDHALIRNDLTGMLFAQAVLGSRDVQWLWTQIAQIARRHGCLAGGDTDCARANTAMFMAGGFTSKDLPQSLAALCRVFGASRTLVAFESGAVGPGKDCAYENAVIKAVAGVPISTEGKSAACGHSSLCGNVMAATCDLWSNEAVEYHRLFGGTTPAVFAEILGYDAAAMNAALQLGYQEELQACLVNSDRYRSLQGFLLSPDNAWAIGKALVDHGPSPYARARAAGLLSTELVHADPRLQLTAEEREALQGYARELEDLPDREEDFIDLCLSRFAKVKGFRPASYGL